MFSGERRIMPRGLKRFMTDTEAPGMLHRATRDAPATPCYAFDWRSFDEPKRSITPTAHSTRICVRSAWTQCRCRRSGGSGGSALLAPTNKRRTAPTPRRTQMTAPIPSQSTPESSNTPNALVMTDILIGCPCRSVAASLRKFDRPSKSRASACFFLKSLAAAKSGRSRGHAPASERAAARIIAAGTNRRPPRGKTRAKRPVLPRRVRIVCPRSDRSEAEQTRRHRDRHKKSHFVLPLVGGAIRSLTAPAGLTTIA
jgi:hypothetical protein